MRIFLIGFMGCGKTFVGKALSKSLGINHIDLDQKVEEQEGMTISELFDLKGEGYFRRIEYNLLKNLIIDHEHLILSLGGGAPCAHGIMQLLRFSGTPVYLKLTNGQLFDRLKNESENRPLIKGKSDSDLKLYIDATLKDRAPTYELAKITVDGGQDIDSIVSLIKRQLQ